MLSAPGLGVVGPIAAFGLFFLDEQMLGLPQPQLQTPMCLLLSMAGT